MQFVIDKRIALEVCVTSNLQTKAVASFAEHPIRTFFDAGVIVAPSTDNRMVSDVTLTSEYDLLQRSLGFGVEEIVRLLDYGFANAFLSHSERRRLRAESFRLAVNTLVDAGIDVSAIHRRWSYYGELGVSHHDIVGSKPTPGLVSPPYWGQVARALQSLLSLLSTPSSIYCSFLLFHLTLSSLSMSVSTQTRR